MVRKKTKYWTEDETSFMVDMTMSLIKLHTEYAQISEEFDDATYEEKVNIVETQEEIEIEIEELKKLVNKRMRHLNIVN